MKSYLICWEIYAHGRVSACPKVYACSMKQEQSTTRTDCVICKENSRKCTQTKVCEKGTNFANIK